MDPAEQEEFIDTVKRVAALLQRADVRFALTGGCAVWARGGAMSEHDIDFLIRERDVDTALETLADDGLRVERPPEDWLVKAWNGRLLIDLIFRPVQRPVTDATLDEAEVIPVGGAHLPVVSATVLMEHKLLSLNAHTCDLVPALQLARLLREQIDWPRVVDAVGASPYGAAFLTLAERLEIMDGTDGNEERS